MIERQGNDGDKVWYQHVGERNETKQVSSNSRGWSVFLEADLGVRIKIRQRY